MLAVHNPQKTNTDNAYYIFFKGNIIRSRIFCFVTIYQMCSTCLIQSFCCNPLPSPHTHQNLNLYLSEFSLLRSLNFACKECCAKCKKKTEYLNIVDRYKQTYECFNVLISYSSTIMVYSYLTRLQTYLTLNTQNGCYILPILLHV